MKLFHIVLIIQCTDLVIISKAFRERENDNQLVPNNDVNVHAKIKNFLYSDNIELSDNELAKYPFIKRILHRDKYNYEINTNEIDIYDSPARNSPPVIVLDLLKEKPESLPSTTSTTTPTPNPSANEECLFGTPNENIKWVDELGKLKIEYINSNDEMSGLKFSDHSYEFADAFYDFRLFLKDTYNMLLFQVSIPQKRN